MEVGRIVFKDPFPFFTPSQCRCVCGCAFRDELVSMQLHEYLLLLVSRSRCVIDKEDMEVCVYDMCSQCVCVCVCECAYDGA